MLKFEVILMVTFDTISLTMRAVATSKETWNFTVDSAIITDKGIALVVTGSNNNITLNGLISGGRYEGVNAAGEGNNFNVSGTGSISGVNGFTMHRNNDLDTSGRIVGLHSGIQMFGESDLYNDGIIRGLYNGVETHDAASNIVNDTEGVIRGSQFAIQTFNGNGETVSLINRGKITAEQSSYTGQDGINKVKNTGIMDGDIDLRGGNDSIDTRGGTIDGSLYGGAGDDTLVTDKNSIKLKEVADKGYDTVKSSVSYTLSTEVEQLILTGSKNINGTGTSGYNDLYGNSGNNVLKGKGGADNFYGGKGNDHYYGGDDDDVYVLQKGTGKDVVHTFDDGTDFIQITGWGTKYDSYGDISSKIKNHGDGDVWITLDTTGTLVIENTTKSQLTTDDFWFD